MSHNEPTLTVNEIYKLREDGLLPTIPLGRTLTTCTRQNVGVHISPAQALLKRQNPNAIPLTLTAGGRMEEPLRRHEQAAELFAIAFGQIDDDLQVALPVYARMNNDASGHRSWDIFPMCLMTAVYAVEPGRTLHLAGKTNVTNMPLVAKQGKALYFTPAGLVASDFLGDIAAHLQDYSLRITSGTKVSHGTDSTLDLVYADYTVSDPGEY